MEKLRNEAEKLGLIFKSSEGKYFFRNEDGSFVYSNKSDAIGINLGYAWLEIYSKAVAYA